MCFRMNRGRMGCCAPVSTFGHAREEALPFERCQADRRRLRDERAAIQQAIGRLENAIALWNRLGRPTPTGSPRIWRICCDHHD